MNKTLVASIFLMLLAGCSTLQPNQQSVEFKSNPPGATISYAEENWGVEPVTRVWTLAKGQATAVSGPITATWVSGARTTFTLTLTAGREGTYTIVRPQGVAGLETDVQWAIHLQQQKSAKDAQTNAALMMIMQQQNAAAAARTAPNPPSINCTSHRTGDFVQTNCY